MYIPKQLEQKITSLGGTGIPLGIDPLYDICRILKGFTPDVIVDVGANVGQTTAYFVERFPKALIHCLEPVSTNFDKLCRNAAAWKNVKCHQIALGASKSTVTLEIDPDASPRMISLAYAGKPLKAGNTRQEKVQVQTLTAFCSDIDIDHIGYLKIDTEGYDLEVLRGGQQLLAAKAVDLIEIEAGMNPLNSYHVDMVEIKQYLEKENYFLFGIYEQVHEWQVNKPIMRRANLLFISESLYK